MAENYKIVGDEIRFNVKDITKGELKTIKKLAEGLGYKLVPFTQAEETHKLIKDQSKTNVARRIPHPASQIIKRRGRGRHDREFLTINEL